MLRPTCLVSVTTVLDGTLRRSGVKQLSLSTSSANSRRFNFSVNLALVTLGIRGGYLLDTFFIEDPSRKFAEVLKTLREISSIFKDLKLAYDPNSEQCFFLNISVLAKNASDGWRSCHPDGIFLSEQPSIVELPEVVLEIARGIALYFDESDTDVYRLPSNLQIQSLIPLAGLLLEYPVVYIPISDEQSVFLPGVPLDVYHSSLSFECQPEHNEVEPRHVVDHSLLKFSCPVSIGESKNSLAPQSMKTRIEDLFRERLRTLKDTWTLEITHEIVTLDRVAL